MTAISARDVESKLVTTFTSILKPLGFQKVRRTWLKDEGGFTFVVNLQKSMNDTGPDSTQSIFFVNLGLRVSHDPDSDNLGNIKARLGQLSTIKDALAFHDVSAQAAEEIIGTVATALKNEGLPWLLQFRTVEDLRREYTARRIRRVAAIDNHALRVIGAELVRQVENITLS